MKPLARVAIPESSPPEVVEAIKECLTRAYSFIKIEYELKEGINHPMALSFDPKGVGLGSIAGDKDAPSRAMIEGIHSAANRAFRAATLEG
ncbi:MAG: hypothetical protein H7A51_00980 [Akkermansiaceae bacterium]|nr:hypothetical protein [Akkermansiaceae bacterium]